MSEYQTDKQRARAWARVMLATPGALVLDTETTGLGGDAEICAIAIIDMTGREILNTLVKPTRPIPRDASAIHGITDEKVASAPTFAMIALELRALLSGQTVVIYNADFDTRLMEQSALACGIAIEIPAFAGEYQDAMEPYAAWVGEYSQYHGNYRFQKLPGGDHSAIGDAVACLNLLRRMAGVLNSQITVPVMDDELRGYALHYSKFYKDGDYNEAHESPLDLALSAFVADLAFAYSERAGSPARQRLAHAWLDQWRRDLGWRPIYEPIKKAIDDAP